MSSSEARAFGTLVMSTTDATNSTLKAMPIVAVSSAARLSDRRCSSGAAGAAGGASSWSLSGTIAATRMEDLDRAGRRGGAVALRGLELLDRLLEAVLPG